MLRRLWRSDWGQSAAIAALFLSFIGAFLLTGSVGIALAIAQKARLQDAADAAALAAAREVRPDTTIVVRKYDRVCGPGGKCQDSILPETITLDGRATDLLPDRWLKMAGCDGRLDLKKPGHWTVCEWGSTEQTDWSLSVSRARTAAESYLRDNLQGQTFKNWQITYFRVDANRPMPLVQLEVEAEASNPLLRAVVRKPIKMKVLAWSDSVDRTLPPGAK